jgi:hypothetical protein
MPNFGSCFYISAKRYLSAPLCFSGSSWTQGRYADTDCSSYEAHYLASERSDNERVNEIQWYTNGMSEWQRQSITISRNLKLYTLASYQHRHAGSSIIRCTNGFLTHSDSYTSTNVMSEDACRIPQRCLHKLLSSIVADASKQPSISLSEAPTIASIRTRSKSRPWRSSKERQ